MEEKSKRKQKVYSCYYENCWREFTPYPMIRLAGKYLKKFNFNIGDKLEIDITNEQIIIKRAPSTFPIETRDL
jgi:hypothetical protein